MPTETDHLDFPYRAKPTLAANLSIRALEPGGVGLQWDPVRGVTAWEARIADRPGARSPYTDGETVGLSAPTLELRLEDLSRLVSITRRNAAGAIVQRAVAAGLTNENGSSK